MATTLISRKAPDGWESFIHDHRVNTGMNDADAKTLTDYVIANFNTNVPDFDIPPQLLAGEVITPF
ncbi:MAG: hypothetical protein ABIG98_05900 [Chloroflexota bacterium]